MGDFWCFLVSGSMNLLQFVIDLLYSFWGLFGVTAPDIHDAVGSLFGCDI